MMARRSSGRRPLRLAGSMLLRGAAFAFVWVLLAGWDTALVGYGAVSIVAATWLSLVLVPVSPPDRAREVGTWRRLWAAVVLPVWFMGKSVAGGVDVALRALRRPVDVQPAVVEARCRLPEGHARQLALLMMNLMPGTMVQQIDGDVVELHTVSESLEPDLQWEALQRRVAPAFGISIR